MIDDDHLVERLGPLDRVKGSRLGDLAAEQTPQFWLEHISHQRTLAAPRHPGHTEEHAERKGNVDPLEIVVTHAAELDARSCWRAALLRHLDRIAAGEKGSRQAALIGCHIVGRAGGDHLPPALARPGAKIDHPVGGPDRLFIMLDDDDGVPLVAQGFKRAEQLDIVAGMEADRGFVEHIEHAGEAGADLGCQPDALALAAGERGGPAFQRQISQPDSVEEFQAGSDLLEQLCGDHRLRRIEHDLREERAGSTDRQGAELVERQLRRPGFSWRCGGGLTLRGFAPRGFFIRCFAGRRGGSDGGADAHGAGLRREPGAAAHVAGGDAHQLFEHPPQDATFGIPPAVGEHRQNPFELGVRSPFRLAPFPGELHFFHAGAGEPDLLLLRREIFPGGVEERAGGELALRLGMGGDAGEQPPHPAGHVAEAAEHPHRAFAQRFLRRRDELLRVDAIDVAEPFAGRAGALRAVEAEELRLGCVETEPAGHAGIAAGEHQIAAFFGESGASTAAGFRGWLLRGLLGRLLIGVGYRTDRTGGCGLIAGHDHLPAAGAQGQFHRLCQPATPCRVGHKPVDHHIDRVLEELLQRRRILHPHNLSVDAGPREALPHQIGEQIAVLPRRLAHQRGEHEHPLA